MGAALGAGPVLSRLRRLRVASISRYHLAPRTTKGRVGSKAAASIARLRFLGDARNKLLGSAIVWLDVAALRSFRKEVDTHRIGVARQSNPAMSAPIYQVLDSVAHSELLEEGESR